MSSDQETEPTSLEQSNLNSLELWDYTVELECLQGSQDLQLAAELGKTLLERNKELETGLRQHQNIIEDQTQEIEYLTKQTVALREVNDSRLRIYEQLEVSIQDLERANNRLALDHTADKKHIKSLCSNIETLEGKCEELQKKTEDVTSELDMYRKKAERKPESVEKTEKKEVLVTSKQPAKIEPTLKPVAERLNYSTPVKSIYVEPVIYSKEHEDLLKISDELRESKIAFAQEQRRVSELEEQLASMVQENNRLQDQMRELHQKDDEPKSMQEEFSILEEVRQGQLCIRCLRGVNDRAQDELSSLMDADDDDRSAISSLLLPPTHMENVSQEIRNQPHKYLHIQAEKEKALASVWSNSSAKDNPYRELVEKYEALLEVQLSQVNNIRKNKQLLGANAALINNNSGPMSLHEEIQTSGDFSQHSLKDGEEESGHFETNKIQEKGEKIETGNRKKLTQTPDFSEAETSSSGFSDETSNKGTQTDKERPGSFLCTIADGEDYCFSIYDDASPIDSRFRNRPEYRELFKEIFTILKKAAENKDEGEKLPLLDDSIPACGKVPPVTPANEEAPGNFTDDTQSVMSSVMSEQSIPLSDITIPEAPAPKEKEKPTPPPEKPAKEQNKENKVVENSKPKNNEPVAEPQRVLTPLLRQPLEYLAAGSPHLRKKSKNRNRKQSQDRQGADSPVFPSPPKITYQKSGGRKKRDYRPLESSPLTKVPLEPAAEWNGTTMQFYNRSLNSPTPSVSAKPGRTYQSWNPDTDTWDTKQCTASQEINKLRRLELSYAEVLRNADKNKGRRKKHQ